jgi:hypothetical protein
MVEDFFIKIENLVEMIALLRKLLEEGSGCKKKIIKGKLIRCLGFSNFIADAA